MNLEKAVKLCAAQGGGKIINSYKDEILVTKEGTITYTYTCDCLLQSLSWSIVPETVSYDEADLMICCGDMISECGTIRLIPLDKVAVFKNDHLELVDEEELSQMRFKKVGD